MLCICLPVCLSVRPSICPSVFSFDCQHHSLRYSSSALCRAHDRIVGFAVCMNLQRMPATLCTACCCNKQPCQEHSSTTASALCETERNHRVAPILIKLLQAILYSFPAICWLYGAGLMFSSFASLVFWGQPAARLWEKLRARFTTVLPVGLQVCSFAFQLCRLALPFGIAFTLCPLTCLLA